MGELELIEIERRAEHYPARAREDILRLTGELRRAAEASGQKKTARVTSPLYDALTGLLNAGAYGVRFAAARARATRYRKMFAVMSVELPAGAGGASSRDEAVKAVAHRLDSCVRATDTLARVGEDSFAIILEDLTQPDHAERVKQTVQDALAAPMQIGGRPETPPTRVSLKFYPEAEAGSALH